MGVRAAVAGVLVLAAVAAAAQLPPTWPRCRQKDPNIDVCLQHGIQEAIRQLATGLPELDLPPLEGLFTKEGFTIERRPGRVSLQIKLSNLHAYGFSNIKINNVFSDLDNGVIDMHGDFPLTAMNADVQVEGSILHEPVSPQRGSANFTFHHTDGILVVSGRKVDRKGDSYLDVNYAKGTFLSVHGLGIHFDQLDKSPQRSSKLNYLLNNNALSLWPDLRDQIEKLYSEGFRQMAKNLFSKVPLKDIFLADDHAAVKGGPSLIVYA